MRLFLICSVWLLLGITAEKQSASVNFTTERPILVHSCITNTKNQKKLAADYTEKLGVAPFGRLQILPFFIDPNFIILHALSTAQEIAPIKLKKAIFSGQQLFKHLYPKHTFW